MPCGEISASISYDCQNPLQGGNNPSLYLFNYDDVVGVVADGTTDNLITDITRATGKAAYKFEGYRNSLTPSQESLLPDTGQMLFKHQVNFFVFSISQIVKNQIQQLALGRFIAIVENNGKNADSFEVYGLGNGMELTAQELRNSNANNGAYNLILATADGEFEPKLPLTLFDTDYATTKAKITGYLTP